jgi:hypothetical protein
MRKRARTDLCGGRSVMVVPTATVIASGSPDFNAGSGILRCSRRVYEVAKSQKSPMAKFESRRQVHHKALGDVGVCFRERRFVCDSFFCCW